MPNETSDETIAERMAREMGLTVPQMRPAGGADARSTSGAALPRVDLEGKPINPYEPSIERHGDPDAAAKQRSRFETGVEIAGALGGGGIARKVATKLGQTGLKLAASQGFGAGLGEAGVRQFTADLEENESRSLDTAKAFARGALGETLGLAGNRYLLEPLGKGVVAGMNRVPGARRLVNPFRGKLEEGAEAAIKQLEPEGVRPTPGQLSTSKWVDSFENVVDASLFGSGRLQAARGKAEDVATKHIRAYVEEFVGKTSPEEAGMLLGSALDNTRDAHSAAVRASYRKLDRAIGGEVQVDLGRVLGITKAERKKTEMLGKSAGSGIRSMLDDILKTEKQSVAPGIGAAKGAKSQTVDKFMRGEKVSFEEAAAVRSMLLERGRSGTDVMPARTEALANRLAKLVDHQMSLAAKGTSGEVYELWRGANALSSQGHTAFNNRVMKSMMNQVEPERVYEAAVSGASKPSRIRHVRKIVEEGVAKGQADPLTWSSVQGQWVDDIARKAMNEETQTMSGGKLLTSIKQMGPERLAELFPVDRGKNITQFARTLAMTQKSASANESFAVAMKLSQAGAVLSLPATLSSEKTRTPAITGTTIIILGPIALSRLLTNPSAARLLTTGMTSGPTKFTSRMAGQLLSHIDLLSPRGSAFMAKEPGAGGTPQPEQSSVPSITDISRGAP